MIAMSLGGLVNKVRRMVNNYLSGSDHYKARSIHPNQTDTPNISDIASATPPYLSGNTVEIQGTVAQAQRSQTGVEEQLFIRNERNTVLPTGNNIARLIEALKEQGYEATSIHVSPEGSTSYTLSSVSKLANSDTPYTGVILMFGPNKANIAYLQLSKGGPGWRNVKGAFFDYTIRAPGGIDPSSKEIGEISDAIKKHTFNYPPELLQVRIGKPDKLAHQ